MSRKPSHSVKVTNSAGAPPSPSSSRSSSSSRTTAEVFPAHVNGQGLRSSYSHNGTVVHSANKKGTVEVWNHGHGHEDLPEAPTTADSNLENKDPRRPKNPK